MTANRDQLIVRLGDTVVQMLPLMGPIITIGRSSDNTLRLPHRSVSRHHAEIRVEDGATMIVDLGSVNGIQVDGERLPAYEIRSLRRGAFVQIGPYALTCLDEAGREIPDIHALDDRTVLDVHADLHIEIDARRRQQQVDEVIESEYFQRLRDAKQRLQSKD